MNTFYTHVTVRGDAILLRGFEDGLRFQRREQYKPRLFVPNKTGDWKTLSGECLAPIEFSGIRDAEDYARQYSDVSNFRLYGLDRFAYTFINETYLGDIDFDVDKIRIANIDIEVASNEGFPDPEDALYPIIAATIRIKGRSYVFGTGDFSTDREDVEYVKCSNEDDILARFVTQWASIYPDIVTGWNVENFDIPYIARRVRQMDERRNSTYLKMLSPWGDTRIGAGTSSFGPTTRVTIEGIAVLDYMVLYKKFTYVQRESYRLGYIAHIELDDNKIDYSQYETLHNLYLNNYQKFIEYNIKDVDIVDRLEDKLRLIEMAIVLAYDAKVNYNDVFTQVRMWDIITHNHLWKRRIAVPTVISGKKTDSFVGAYVKDPQLGMHDWVMSFDLNSLYPHLILQYNISPETLQSEKIDIPSINWLLENTPQIPNDCSLAPNGCLYSNKKQGFLPEIMQRMYDDRVIYKNKMIDAQKTYEVETDTIKKHNISKLISRYKNLQMAKKIQMNSCYGAMGNPWFRFFNINNAVAITLGGQLAIRWVEIGLNTKLNKMLNTNDIDYVIASDTDSIYIKFGALIEKVKIQHDKAVDYLDKVANAAIQPVIDKIYKNLAEKMNCFSQKMQMKRESIADRGIWTAKKRYILNVYDNEGVRYAKPKLKVMGIEAVKSSTPASCREAITHAIKLIVTTDQPTTQQYIAEFKEKFFKLPFDEIAFPRSVQSLSDYTLESKGIPIHVRAALAFNNKLKSLRLNKKYELIKPGEKMKFCYMKTVGQNVMGAMTILPREFNLADEIDYELQFNKAFLSPLETILNIIGWSAVARSTLENFFNE